MIADVSNLILSEVLVSERTVQKKCGNMPSY
jgi:hypothetical protein